MRSAKWGFAFVGILLIVLAPLSSAIGQPYGKLRVSGTSIVGENGSPVQLRGMSLFWSQWMGQYWRREVIDWLADDWKVTVVRAAMGIDSGGYLTNPEEEKRKLKAVVEAAIAKNIYVIIDWHDHNATSHTDQAKAFFKEMAETYGKHPHVLYEIYNEPERQSWSDEIKPYSEAVIKTIRAADPDNIIIVGTRFWSQEVDVASEDPIKGTNLAYTLHFYAASHGDELRQRARKAIANGLALFVTEWGTPAASADGPINHQSVAEWMKFMDEHRLSWCNWSIADKTETASVLAPGASVTGGWTEANLTESGKFIREKLREAAKSDPPAIGGNPKTDTTKPRVQLRSPGKGATVARKGFEIAGVVTDDTALASIAVKVGTRVGRKRLAGKRGTFRFKASKKTPAAKLTIVVSVTDAAGNRFRGGRTVKVQ